MRYDDGQRRDGVEVKRFRLWLIPELLRLSNEDYQWMVFRHAVGRGWIQWWLSACIAIPAFASLVRWYPLTRRIAHDPLWNIILQVGLYVLVWLVIEIVLIGSGYRLLRSGIRRTARAYMRRRYDVAICIPCGYDLTGNTNGVCPECGAAGSVEYEA